MTELKLNYVALAAIVACISVHSIKQLNNAHSIKASPAKEVTCGKRQISLAGKQANTQQTQVVTVTER